MNANTEIQDRQINRIATTRRYERKLRDKVYTNLVTHEKSVQQTIINGEKSKLLSSLDKVVNKTFSKINNFAAIELVKFAKDQISFTYQNLETSTKNYFGLNRPDRTVADNLVLDRPLVFDSTLSEGWSGVAMQEKQRLAIIIRKGIADGDSLDTIALAVRKGNVHNITRNQSRTLVTTALTSVYNQADHAVYRANKDVLRGYQYIAILDSRTTKVCAARSGNIYDIGDVEHLPPAHYGCRSFTSPVFKSWSDILVSDNVALVRRRNLKKLSKREIEYFDGQQPLQETYSQWLLRQPQDIQLKHLGNYKALEALQRGDVVLANLLEEGESIGLKQLRALTSASPDGSVRKFAIAKEKLEAMQLGISTPEDLLDDAKLARTLTDYYVLQTRELGGTLSYTNYRGVVIHNKRNMQRKVMTTPPTEEQLRFNPITNRYEDSRMYAPNPGTFARMRKLVNESHDLLERDKLFINNFVDSLNDKMSMNERAVVSENLRNIFQRYRKKPEPFANFKSVVQAQVKYDVMNVSDAIETQLRSDANPFKKLLALNFLDPVLGPSNLKDLADNFIANIIKKNRWEDIIAPRIAKQLRDLLDAEIAAENPVIWARLSDRALQEFYLRFTHRLSLADSPDIDALAVSIGRDLYTQASLNGDRNAWYNLGLKILKSPKVSKLYTIETFGVQKRRMRSRVSGNYFGPYYDTFSYNINIIDPRIREFAMLTRKVDVGMRVSTISADNRLIVRPGYKTYFYKRNGLYHDTRIPIMSTSSYSNFPVEFIDDKLANALNWASSAEYKIDPDFHDAIRKLVYFRDDKGKATYYEKLNSFKHYLAERGDTYERFKVMEWLRKSDLAFSNNAFIDHRGRIYERGFIGPQAGETFNNIGVYKFR